MLLLDLILFVTVHSWFHWWRYSECVAVSQMPRLWVGGAEAEIDARSTYFKREKGRTTHCIHSDFIIKSSFTKFVNMFSFFRPMTKRVFHPLMSFSAIFKLYQVTNAFLNSNIKLQRDIWLVEINKSINSPISHRTGTLRVNVVCFGAVFFRSSL